MSQVWLIGHPVAHSLSPAMHNAAFAKLGLPHRYELKETADDQLVATLDRMRREDVLGANVTIPHKEAVLRLLDEVDDEARRIGAVNTIVSRAERLVASMPSEKTGTARAVTWDQARQMTWVDALVNATPLGMHGEDALEGFAFEPLPAMIADLVPMAEETPLVRRAREAQHVRVMDGLLMLLHQAARSFELWTGVPAPLEVMRAALPRRV